MIRYELYDQYGAKQCVHEEEATDCGTVILQHNGNYYRPVSYDLNSDPNTAKCIPVNVINCAGAGSHEKKSE
jgi:hypothetical protein